MREGERVGERGREREGEGEWERETVNDRKKIDLLIKTIINIIENKTQCHYSPEHLMYLD